MKQLLILLILLSCTHDPEVKINLYAKKVMDIEIPAKNIIPHCSTPGDPEKKNSWFGIYVFYNERVELLSERRQRLPKECEKYKEEMVQFLSKSTRARVIGIESFGQREDPDLSILLKDPNMKAIDESWIFSRIITDKGCFGWQTGCEEPRLVEKDRYTNINE